jgi:hypothetical protein
MRTLKEYEKVGRVGWTAIAAIAPLLEQAKTESGKRLWDEEVRELIQNAVFNEEFNARKLQERAAREISFWDHLAQADRVWRLVSPARRAVWQDWVSCQVHEVFWGPDVETLPTGYSEPDPRIVPVVEALKEIARLARKAYGGAHLWKQEDKAENFIVYLFDTP